MIESSEKSNSERQPLRLQRFAADADEFDVSAGALPQGGDEIGAQQIAGNFAGYDRDLES